MREIVRYSKFLFYDISYNIKAIKLRVLFSTFLILGVFLLTNQTNFENEHEDRVISFLYGADYNEESTLEAPIESTDYKEKTNIPLRWLLINTITLVMFIDFFSKDFKGRNNLIFSRINVSKYYLIKVISLLFTLLFSYLVIFSTLVLFNISTIQLYGYEFLRVFILYFLTSFTFLLIYNSVSLYLNYKISLIIILISILGPLKWNNFLLIGQHSLIARHIPYSRYQILSFENSIWYLIIVTLCTIITSYNFLQNNTLKRR